MCVLRFILRWRKRRRMYKELKRAKCVLSLKLRLLEEMYKDLEVG